MFLLFFLSFSLYAQDSLQFESIRYQKQQKELSGLHYQEQRLFTVADKKSNHYIYEIINDPNSKNLITKKYIDLSKLQGFDTYFYTTLLLPQFGKWIKSPLDLEGITKCGEDFYVVNEQVRHVLKINQNEIQKLDINFLNYFDKYIVDASSTLVNAGFEGVAIDCQHQRLFVAQERSPRRILIINLDNNKILEDFTIESDPKQKNKDFAGLFYQDHFLYILERNHYQIVKYDLLTKKVVRRMSFKKLSDFDLAELYDTGEVFGLAEGLALSKNKIFITLDNNQKPLSSKAEKEFGIKGTGASLLIFKRPLDF